MLGEKRRWADLTFDEYPVRGATLEDLDLEFFTDVYLPQAVSREVLAQNQRSTADQLIALRLTSPDGIPTVAGVLTLAEDPRRWIPGAYVQFLRIAGTRLTDPIKDQRAFDGRLAPLILSLEDKVKAHVEVSMEILNRPRHEQQPDYPIEALRQYVRNAVLHRAYEGTNAPVRVYWYDDRVEIQNPGGPYGRVSPENFGTPGITDYRNPVLAEVLKVLGFVERFGMGIEIATAELAKNGNPPPEYSADASHTLVTLRRRP